VIISGRELSVWQLHIAARVNPLIENCKQMTIALPTLLDADNKYANELLIEINSRQQQINRFEGDISNPNVRNNAALASISELTDQVKQAETKLSTLRAEILSIDQSVLVACGKH
jgi:chromosome segregation ATPase